MSFYLFLLMCCDWARIERQKLLIHQFCFHLQIAVLAHFHHPPPILIHLVFINPVIPYLDSQILIIIDLSNAKYIHRKDKSQTCSQLCDVVVSICSNDIQKSWWIPSILQPQTRSNIFQHMLIAKISAYIDASNKYINACSEGTPLTSIE